MKKLLLSIVAGFAGVSVTMAQVPYSNDFETAVYDGESVFSNAAYSTWSGNGVAVITNITYGASDMNTTGTVGTLLGLPLQEVAHTRVLYSETPLTNNVTNAADQPIVSFDMMVKPSFIQDLGTSQALSNAHFGLTFTTNGYLAIYHAFYNPGNESLCPTYDGQVWSVFSNKTTTVSSGKWVRITINMNFLANASDSFLTSPTMFQVLLDGIAASNGDGYAVADLSASQRGGSWFASLNQSINDAAILHRMTFTGTGHLDDLNIQTSELLLRTVTHEIPYSWFTLNGLTIGSPAEMEILDTTDSDGDGMPNWAEFIAGTHPTNSASRLAIVSQIVSNGVPRVRWLTSTAAIAPYQLDNSTNLTAGAGWQNITNGIIATGTGTNECVFPAATNSPTFFRVKIVP